MKLRFATAVVFALGTTAMLVGTTALVATTGARPFQGRGAESPAASDWPQWQGPDRTGLSKETGLLQQWPASGPAVVRPSSGLAAGRGSIALQADRDTAHR